MKQATEQPRTGSLRRTLLAGNVLWLSLVSLLNDTASEMIYPLMPLFLTTVLGATPVALGVIEGAAESVSSLLKLASGWVSDRFHRRKALILVGYGMAAVLRPLIAVVAAAWQLLLVRLGDRMGKGIRGAPRDALLAESVPPEMRGRAFGFHRAADHAGAVLGPLLGALLLALLAGNLRLVFALAIIPGLISVFVLLFFVHERDGTDSRATTTPPAAGAGKTRPELDARVLHGNFARYLFVLVLFTLGNATDAFLLVRAGELGIPVAAVPLLWGIHNVSKMVWSYAGGAMADRAGPRPTIVLGWIVYAASYACFAFATEAWHAWALFVLYGLFYGLTEAPEKALVAALAPEGRRGSAFGAYHAAIGFAALPASIMFGWIWYTFGATAAFLTGASLALAAAILLFGIVNPTAPPPKPRPDTNA